jgi:hypothetical protein
MSKNSLFAGNIAYRVFNKSMPAQILGELS